MAHVVKDRVQETSTTTGTGTLTLLGAVSGFQTFSSAIGNTNTTYYTIQNGAEWEVGIGTVGAGTLSRDTILESSNSGSAVNFSAGTKQVFCTYPAEKSVDLDTAQTLTNKTISGSSNTLSNIGNSSLTNSSITINGTPVSLGGSASVGTVTSVGVTAGTGISVSGSPVTGSGSITVTNTAPDQTVSLTAGSNISITGTYPSFTIASTAGGSGDVTGPASSTDNAIARFDGITGKIIQNSAVVVTDTGRIGVGTTNPSSLINVYDASSSIITLDGEANTSLILNRASNNATNPTVAFRKSRGTVASPTAVQSGDNLGLIGFSAYNGTTHLGLGLIECLVDTYTSSSDISTFIRFSVSAPGSTAASERMRILPSGAIAFNGSTNYGTSGQLLQSNGNAPPTWVDGVTASSTTTFTNKTISADNNTISGIAASSFVLSNASGNIDGAAAQKAIPSGVVVGTTDTQTLTNKRVTPRVSTITSNGTPTINTDNVDVFGITALAVNITSFTTNLSGTPTDGQTLRIYIVGTAARTLTWGASFESSTVTLPSTTVSTNRMDIGFVWNAATSKWRCVAVS